MNELWLNFSNRRYYRLLLCKDLFGDSVLIKEWGSMDRNGGRVVTTLIDKDKQNKAIASLRRKRVANGYVVVENINS